MHLLTVIGNPIEQSLSPAIHRQFAKQCKIALTYDKTLCDNNFDQLINELRTTHLGCNVTAPFKTDAYTLSDELTDNALQAQAVNTLTFSDDKIIGHNTDGVGLITDLTQNLTIDLTHKTILIIGAGGAARGIIAPLLQQHVKRIFIINRTFEKAQQLAKTFFSIGDVFAIKQLTHAVDIIINTTPPNSKLQLDANWLAEHTLGYDLTYANQTPFMQWLAKRSIAHHNGLGMLIEQAAESFYFWFGVKPDTKFQIPDKPNDFTG